MYADDTTLVSHIESYKNNPTDEVNTIISDNINHELKI